MHIDLKAAEVLLLPFLACLVLASVHTYLGTHVLRRKVLFVDLALAQMAALGTTVAFLKGYEAGESWVPSAFAFGFAALGAAVFAITRSPSEKIPQEAVIGLVFAIAAAAASVLAASNPHGAEHLQHIMTGNIVVVRTPQVVLAAVVYAVVGVFHWVFRKPFLQITEDPAGALAEGRRVRLWDFLFYLSFGAVITLSVQIAGVLLVFCLLIAPAVCGALFGDRLRTRLITGWGVSLVACGAGLALSFDRPTGPMIILLFAGLLVLFGLVKYVHQAPGRPQALVKVLAGAVTCGLLGLVLHRIPARAEPEAETGGTGHAHTAEHGTGSSLEDRLHALKDEHAGVRAEAVRILAGSPDARVPAAIIAMLEDADDAVVEAAAEAVAARKGRADSAPALEKALLRPHEDAYAPLRLGQALLDLGRPKGAEALLTLAADTDAPSLARDEALRSVRPALGLAALREKVSVRDAAGKKALEEAREWWKKHGAAAAWDEKKKAFRPGA